MFRIGTGFDVHAFEPGNKIYLCGVEIPFDRSLAGHSDADVALHALTDAILGALALGDIGLHFPDTDEKWKKAKSIIFLNWSLKKAKQKKYKELFLQNQDKKSGLFIDPLSSLKDANSIDLESSYIHYQTTAFSLSAIDALGGHPNHKLAFLDSFRGKKKLSSFFHTIDWKNAWHESNKIMFLLQFFSYDFLKNKNKDSYDNIVFILDFLDNYQDPRTGLWGTQYKASTFVGMAAAYHFLIFYKYFNRKINFPNKIFQNVFILQMKDGLFHPFGGGGACEDLDAIDVVSKVTSELSADSINHIKLAYNALIQNYDKNGGFCWAKRPQFPFLNGIKYLNPRSALFNYDMVKWIIKNNYIGSFLPFFRSN